MAKTNSETNRDLKTPPQPNDVHRWTFLSNHAHALAVIDSRQHDIILREIAAQVGITERAVQRIVVELEEEGYLIRTRVGRCNHYQVRTSLPLRHPNEAHRTIGDLLRLIKLETRI